MIITRSLVPVTNGIPVDLKGRIGTSPVLKCAFDTGNAEELIEPVRVEVIDDGLVGYLVLSKLTGSAGLQGTFHRVTEQIVGCRPSLRVKQRFCIREPCGCEELKVCSIQFPTVVKCGLTVG